MRRGAEAGPANVAPPVFGDSDGVYAAWFAALRHGPVTGFVVPGERYQARCRSGQSTFSGRTRTVEAFVLDTTLTSTVNMWPWTSSGVSAAEEVRIGTPVAAMGADTERARDCLRVDGSCGRDPGWHLRRLCL